MQCQSISSKPSTSPRLLCRRAIAKTPGFGFSIGQKEVSFLRYINRLGDSSRFYQDARLIEDYYSQLKEVESTLEDGSLTPEDQEFYKQEKKEIETAIAEEIERIEDEVIDDYEKDEDSEIDSVILEFRGGAGGEESYLFAEEMMNVYNGYLISKGYSVQSNDKVGSTSKSLSFKAHGNGVYSFIKSESGVHKVIRVPATEAKGRLHSSTISLVVLPSVPFEFVLNDKEVRYEYCRAQGPGGQHVNKTESACRATHIPTGVSVFIQDNREQHKNKLRATEVLRDKIYQIEFQKKKESEKADRKSQIGSGDRSDKIRTYNFQQDRITDHRLNKTVYGISKQLGSGEFFDECIEEIQGREYEEKIEKFYEYISKCD